MSKWRDFLEGVERKDLLSLIEELSQDVGLLKPKSLNEEVRLSTINNLLYEIKLKAKDLNHKNEVLQNKIKILEEDLDL
jgi:hypothetical protein